MPLISCQECDAQISTKAAACPRCGCARKAVVTTHGGRRWKAAGVCLILLAVWFGVTIDPRFEPEMYRQILLGFGSFVVGLVVFVIGRFLD